MKALICLTVIIVSNWFLSKVGKKHGYIQLYVGQYPIWVQQIVSGRWSLYKQEVEVEEYVGVGPQGLIKENIKTKRYYLSTAQGIKELTPSNYKSVILELTPSAPKYKAVQRQIGLEYNQIPALVKQYNDWSSVSQYTK
ncbi:MAG: hypothetical protein HRU41_29155 [Saprospiraceae bacterium]|nr:hypothetical protein [Saprospiraceae bacterium]